MKKIEVQNNLRKNLIAIYGAGEAGVQVKNILECYEDRKVFCFLDDDENKIERNIDGIKVLSFDNFIILKKKVPIIDVIIAIPSLSFKKRNFLTQKLLKNNFNVFLLPEKKFIYNNRVDIDDIKPVNFNDIFLEKKKFFYRKNNHKIYNKNILITGGAGSIGSELCVRVLKYKPKKLVVFDLSEISIYNLKHRLEKVKNINYIVGDVSENFFLKKIIKRFKINILIHAAASKHVNILEKNVPAAIKNNIIGTLSVLNSCSEKVEKVIIVSTDKAVKPKSVLGISKRFAELISLNYNFIYKKKLNISIVRFGNVFASKGSAINLFIKQILNNDIVTITSKKVRRFFMSLEDACYLITETIKIRDKNKIYIFQMGKDFKIIDIIKKLYFFLGKKDSRDLRIKEIGLQKGEKLKEALSYSKNYNLTKIKYVLKVNEKSKYDYGLHRKYVEFIKDNYFLYNKKKLMDLFNLITK
jgi:FlaA1/EpsC-like NDP-sugar epimerase